MALAYYFDHNVPRAISEGLALRGVDVLTCLADGTEALEDSQVLDRASELDRVLFTMDDDLLREARARQVAGETKKGTAPICTLELEVSRSLSAPLRTPLRFAQSGANRRGVESKTE